MATTAVDPADDVIVVSPSDTINLAKPCRAIRVAGAGNVQIQTLAGNTVVCAFLAGETRALRATRIWNTNTTATTIEAMI